MLTQVSTARINKAAPEHHWVTAMLHLEQCFQHILHSSSCRHIANSRNVGKVDNKPCKCKSCSSQLPHFNSKHIKNMIFQVFFLHYSAQKLDDITLNIQLKSQSFYLMVFGGKHPGVYLSPLLDPSPYSSKEHSWGLWLQETTECYGECF